MSEFKYACPVCGQHIKCDSSQCGTVMECPTCLQKITPPQPPAEAEQKFILSGKKVVDRPTTTFKPPAKLVTEVSNRSFLPIILVGLVLLVAASGAAAFVMFRGHSAGSGIPPAAPSRPPASQAANKPANKPAKPAAPPAVIPPANDTDWVLNLTGVDFPDTPAAGRIHGHDFLCERATYSAGTLTLRVGTRGTIELGIAINLNGAQPEALAGTTVEVTTNSSSAPAITLRWKDTDKVTKDTQNSGYAMRIEFGALAKNRLPGKIYFCLSDDAKSYVAGTFNADARKPKAPKPAATTPAPAN